MTYKKISILTFILLLISFIGIIIIQNEQTEDDYESKKNTISHSSGESITQSDIESDTLERLKTHSESSTGWGMSPFGSGKPLTEESPQKTAFQMPNTEWKTRTLSGITYEFGKGNPKEVALDANQLNAYSLCKAPFLDPSYGNIEGQCAEGRGYVTPEVEEYLLLALSDPNWSKLATECEKNFRVVENNDTLINGQNDPSFPYFDRVFASGFLNIDHFISIDPSTGLKILNVGLTQSLPLFLSTASHYGTRKEDGFVNPYGDCVDQYGSEIARNILLAFSIYKDSLDHIQGYTNKYLLSKDFTLSDY